MDKKPEETLQCVCCFCGQTIVGDKVEPMAINVFERGADHGQQFFAHVDCLKRSLHKSATFLGHKDRV